MMAGAEKSSGLFGLCRFAFVLSRQMPAKLIAELSRTVQEHGAEVVEPDDDGGVCVREATHIISNTSDFPEYTEAMAFMVPVVTLAWVQTSLAKNKQAQIRPFSPDPRMIFSNVSLTCADVPLTDKEAIIGAVLAMGGMESKDLSRQTTHICALSMDHPKCQQAIGARLKCKIVLPHWFDDCFRLGKRIDETPYLLPNPEITRLQSGDEVAIPVSQHLAGATSAQPDFPPPVSDEDSARGPRTVFREKKVMLSWDLSMSSRLRLIVEDIVRKGGGKIIKDDVVACDIFVCQYRQGEQYVRAAQNCKDVGNLSWLYHLITFNEWTSPLKRLLHYPIPKDGIPGFKDLKITLSNYGGEARIYLENLITAAGAQFTKTMKAENTHLITARDSSEKCDAAKDWGIEMVNHLWIEESYASCEKQPLTTEKYSHFPPRTNLGEIIGQTPLDESKLHALYYPGGDLDTKAQRKRKILETARENAYAHGPAAGVATGRQEHKELDVRMDTDEDHVEKSTKLSAVPAPSKQDSSPFKTPARGRHVRVGKENDTPTIMSSGSRSAKDKAVSKLHNMAPDLALYEKEKKRASKDGHGPWGGKRALDQYERGQSKTKSSSPAHERPDDDDEERQRPMKKKKSALPPVTMRIALTGYKRWVGEGPKVKANEDNDRRKLRALGIQLVPETQPCEYLAAPQLVRTKKFLQVLATGPTVLNSSFIDACLDSGEAPNPDDYVLKDKESEKKFGMTLSKSIKRARQYKGKLLWNVPIYCTHNIKNGVESYRAVAEANGALFKIYSARGGTTIKPTTAEEDGDAEPEPVYLLTSDTVAEHNLWPRFEEMARKGHMEPRIVASDWLLDAAMKQEVIFDEKYLAENMWRRK